MAKTEEQVTVEVDGRRLKLSNLDKVLYPATGTTKGEVLHYYAQVAPVLLPHLADRAVTRIRWPNGTAEQSFFEKNLPSGAPDWLRYVTLSSTGSRGGGDSIDYPVIEDLAGLTYLANLASLELHVHQWRLGRNNQPKNPDRLVIDLDPGSPAGLHECAQVALLVRDALAERDLGCTPVLSGSKGLHLYARLSDGRGSLDSDGTTALAKEVAEELRSQGVEATAHKVDDNGASYVELATDIGTDHPFQYQIWMQEAPVPVYGRRTPRGHETYARLEVHLREGGQGYDVMGYTHTQLIDDVLDQYERHLQFLHLQARTTV